MAFLTLRDIGKIYVSGGTVAVGIRGVNLSFERGEFVAVTGESGSGKSTLLNIISGMDTYEEGELLIGGEPTSHYRQSDWEEYRRRYISFIFQDYNIIESFTVLQNVELSLMHITDARERRARAVELLRRVGLEMHLHHKGSKLSGGQKQRTVIARALAKDSPVILADEPTGNLDSQTSKEIIELLREVSRDKLVIVVTHSYDQLEDVATRHIRVFDGAVESDRTLTPPPEPTAPKPTAPEGPVPVSADVRTRTVRDGFILGRTRFTAMPKLSVFLTVLMILTALAMTFVTSLTVSIPKEATDSGIFTHIKGRTVISRRDGDVISGEELSSLAASTGAKSALRYDNLLDATESACVGGECFDFLFSRENPGRIDAGRAPGTEGEILLRLPISMKPALGSGASFREFRLGLFGVADYTVTGIDYYYDNTKSPVIVLTDAGYETATMLALFGRSSTYFTVSFTFSAEGGEATQTVPGSSVYLRFGGESETAYLRSPYLGSGATVAAILSGGFMNTVYRRDNHYSVTSDYGTGTEVSAALTCPFSVPDTETAEKMKFQGYELLLPTGAVRAFMEREYCANAYTQASLFYGSDRAAARKAEKLNSLGYIAIPSDATVDGGIEALLSGFLIVVSFVIWAAATVFITLLLSLCSTRTIQATGGDVAILRSMGIPTAVIRASIYFGTLLSLAPAYLITGVTAAVVFLTPKTNSLFSFLHWWEYLLLAFGMLVVNLLLSRRQIRRIFGDSVRKTLKGEAVQ